MRNGEHVGKCRRREHGNERSEAAYLTWGRGGGKKIKKLAVGTTSSTVSRLPSVLVTLLISVENGPSDERKAPGSGGSNTFSNFSPLSNEGFGLFGRCTCGLGVSEELAAEGSFLFCVGVINELVKLSEEVNWPKDANRDDNGGGTERGVETADTEELLELLGEENKAWPEGGGCINISSSVFSTVSRDMPETNVDDFHSAS
ncbi:hypothetical protein C8J57DRAFT_1254262 [Mycena rebaudengoi]|nr:hypothetical protein C8J57DRAFT_1254262 [Mycena rebaudengoi]